MLYGVEGVPGCRENFLAALAEHGLGWTDIVPNVNFSPPCRSTKGAVWRSGPSSRARPSPAITSTCGPSATSSQSSPTALKSTTRLPGAARPQSACRFSQPPFTRAQVDAGRRPNLLSPGMGGEEIGAMGRATVIRNAAWVIAWDRAEARHVTSATPISRSRETPSPS